MIFDGIARLLGISRQSEQIEESRQRVTDRVRDLLDEAVSQNRRTSVTLDRLVRELQSMRDEDVIAGERNGRPKSK